MADFLLGTFDFISLSRPPSRPQEQLAREMRPGEDGVTFFKTGEKTEPFQVTSVRDCSNLEEGLGALIGYQRLAGQVVEMWYGGFNNGDVIVHRVEPLDGHPHVVLLGIGGMVGRNGESSKAMLRCVWVLEYLPLIENQNQQQSPGDAINGPLIGE